MGNMKMELKKEFEELFGELNERQLWFIVKLCKEVRLRCRNNTAFNNYMSVVFGNIAEFDEVTKTKQDGSKYKGLKITVKGGDGI